MVFIKRFSILLIIIQTACDQPEAWDCTRVRGETVFQTRDISNFNAVEIYDHLEVELIQSDTQFIQIESGKNLINDILTTVNDSILIIRDENACGILRDKRDVTKVKIHFKNIYYLETRSSYKVYSIDTLNMDQLLVSKRSNGSLELNVNANHVFVYSNEYGDAIIKGKSSTASVFQQGVGMVDLSGLPVNVLDLNLQGSGTSKLYCTKRVIGKMIRNSKAIIYGNPQDKEVEVSDEASIEYRN